MGRMIEIRSVAGCPSPLKIKVGDLIVVSAFGGKIRAGQDVVELLGPLLPAVLGPTGEIVAPMGTPGTLLILARRAGQADIALFTGDAFHSPRQAEIGVLVSAD